MNKGFTLIELLVVVAIVGILTVAVVFNFVGGRKSHALERQARLVVANIREVQSMALTAMRGNGEVPCGYGFSYDDQDSIIVFKEDSANCTGNKTYDSGEEIPQRLIELEESQRVMIKDTIAFKDVFFEPPDGLVYIDGDRDPSSVQCSEITICSRENCAANQKVIKVCIGGRIELE